MDRICFYRIGLAEEHRWMLLTAFLALSAFFVANAVPFFQDLVSFIGALTSVPLTLLLPAIFYRKVMDMPSLWWPGPKGWWSYALLVFAICFMAAALVGSVDSIFSDWENRQSGFFSCR